MTRADFCAKWASTGVRATTLADRPHFSDDLDAVLRHLGDLERGCADAKIDIDPRCPAWMRHELAGLADQAAKGQFWNCMARLLDLHRRVLKAQIEQLNTPNAHREHGQPYQSDQGVYK